MIGLWNQYPLHFHNNTIAYFANWFYLFVVTLSGTKGLLYLLRYYFLPLVCKGEVGGGSLLLPFPSSLRGGFRRGNLSKLPASRSIRIPPLVVTLSGTKGLLYLSRYHFLPSTRGGRWGFLLFPSCHPERSDRVAYCK